ncbi:SulP family inorganic anion transporter [Paenisporosarcina sp. TG20]|uniref:SulP family inorganic anion transporter n=1 Tax=Paenisporosarcina sp. TG20 TaxID=1211706 RepID=UPI0002D42B0B|nr:SulP family inorganic anion transporter [Paenisporosarcina sp. TG20]
MIFRLMPGLKRIYHYKKSYITGDLTAGIIVAILFIPQSMAYAIIAGVPLVIGLYAATLPLIVYALFGSSKYLSIGPVSIVSLLAFSGISSFAQPDSSYFLELILLLGLIVGSIHLIMGLLKTGYFFDYISPAVISGFTSAVAIIIALNQIKSLLGVSLPPYNDFFSYTLEIIKKLHETNPYTILIGIGSICMLIIIKKTTSMSLGPLIVVIIYTLFVNFYALQKKGVDIVGEIPKGLPELSLNIPTLDIIQLLLPIAFTIAFISFLESYAVVKTLAARDKEQINTNQELVGLGLANISSSLVGSIPVAGAISRTAVNYQSGAKTNLSLLITAACIIITLLFLTPLFHYLPKATLAAIIILAVSNLINLKEITLLLRTSPINAVLLISTFLATLLLNVFWGLLIGIGLSIFINMIRRTLFYTVDKNYK